MKLAAFMGQVLFLLAWILSRSFLSKLKKKQDLLWAMEEGLRSGQPALVIGEIDAVSLVASRRLQLAAEAGGVTAFSAQHGCHEAHL